jgi:hypothetical protein
MSPRLYIRRAKWVDYAYDEGATYWGGGDPIFAAFTYSGSYVEYTRAKNEAEARAAFLASMPGALFV